MNNYEIKVFEKDFSYLNNKMCQEITSIFGEFDFLDLCKAVYCFNSFLGNRAHLEASLLLNLSLIRCKKAGKKRIDSYSAFETFVKKYFTSLSNPMADDPVITDNGEVKIFFDKKFYKVYLGNSYNRSFPLYQVMDTVARRCNIIEDLVKAFEYTENQITRFSNNILPDQYDYEKCYVPTKEYYEEVFSKYSAINNDALLNKFSNKEDRDISSTHFIFKDDMLFPLFNTSLIIDCYHYLTNNKIDKSIADVAFCNSLICNYDLFGDSKSVLIACAIVDDYDKRTVVENFVFKAAMFNRETLILFANIEDWGINTKERIIKQLQYKIDTKCLYLAEFQESKTRIVKLDGIENVILVDYIPDLSILDDAIIPKGKQSFAYHVLDFIHMFYQSENINDIVEFIRLDYENGFNALQCNFSGNVTKFNYWIANNKQVSRGAISFDLISTGVYDDEYLIIEKYKSYGLWFPFEFPFGIFKNPFLWKTHTNYLGFTEISDKAHNNSFGGQARKVLGHFLFLSQNLNLYKEFNQQLLVSLQNMQELNARYFLELEECLINSGFYNYHNIECLHLPLDYAKTIDNTGFTHSKNKYVFSDAVLDGDVLRIRYAVDFDSLFKDMANASDNRIELLYFLELLTCLNEIDEIDFVSIKKAIEELNGDKKKINIALKSIEYYVSNQTYDINISSVACAKAEKEVAIVCKNAGLTIGEYDKKEFCKVIRALQKELVPLFERKIASYDKYALHLILLSRLATVVFNKSICNDRKALIKDANLAQEALQDCENNVLKANDRNTSYIKLIEYLIDTNLAIIHSNTISPTEADVDYLLALSERMMLYQNSSDQAHYNLFPITLLVNDEYLISVLYPDSVATKIDKRAKRSINIMSYLPSVNGGIDFLEDVLENFYKDTGVRLNYVFDVCDYLKYEFTYSFKNEEQPNVFKVKYDDIVSDLFSVFPDVNKAELKNAFDYLIINEDKIKRVGEEMEMFVPIWEREKRVHRIETRPIVRNMDSIIFSPILINSFAESWKNGIFNYYPPYEYGLNNLMRCLEEWKHKSERQMEEDIRSEFPDGCAIKNVDLSKRDKRYGHPANLGDYDVLGVNKNKKILYNLESKYLVLVGSIREYYNQQDGFFNCDKRDEKFQRRIDYITANKERILKELFRVDDGNEYTIKNYMVTNKLFYSELKDIGFEIITISELKTILREDFSDE